MSSIKNVLIVGGGLGGLSLGIALRRAGIGAEIVEIHKEFNVYGVGIIQQANALRALDAIGVADGFGTSFSKSIKLKRRGNTSISHYHRIGKRCLILSF